MRLRSEVEEVGAQEQNNGRADLSIKIWVLWTYAANNWTSRRRSAP